MANEGSFRAFDRNGKNAHFIPHVSRIEKHRLRQKEWPQTRSRLPLAQDLMDELTAKTLHCPSLEISCERCLLPATSPSCTPSCYTSFHNTHFSNPLIELRGPGPLGYGAFVRKGVTIQKHQWVGEYIGELRPIKRVTKELQDFGKQSLYRFDIPVESEKGGGVVVVDSAEAGNWTRFVNSSCGGNLTVQASFLGRRHVLLFRAKRDILEGEELTFAYGKAYFEAAGLLCGCAAREGLHEVGVKRKRKKREE